MVSASSIPEAEFLPVEPQHLIDQRLELADATSSTSATMPSNRGHFLILLLSVIEISHKTNSEEVRDVWHYDMGVAQVVTTDGQLREQREGRPAELSLNSSTSSDSGRTGPAKITTGSAQLNGHREPGQKSSSDETLVMSEEEEAPCNFEGEPLRVAVSPQPPFVNCLQDLYGDWSCNGTNIEVIQVLERRLNFRAEWVVLAHSKQDDDLVSRRQISARQRSKKVFEVNTREIAVADSDVPQPSGIFNLLATGRVLLSANGVMSSLDRSGQNLIVSEPFDSFKLHFLLSKSVHDHDHIFIKPFDMQAWLAILSSVALIVPIFYLINTTSSYYPLLDDKELRRTSLWLCLRERVRLSALARALSGRARRSSSIDSISFDIELSRILAEGQRVRSDRLGPPMIQLNGSPGEKSFKLFSAPPRGESKRRQRLARRRWAHERRRALKMSRKKRKSGFFKLAYIVWYVIASLANQGGETEDLPRANSTRILVAFWWLYLIVICAIHSGILTAILTFPKQSDFIQTLDDYLNLEPGDRNTLRLSVDKYSELAHLLVDSDNLHKSSLQLLQNQSTPISYVNFQRHRQRIMDEVQQGRSAFIEEKSRISQIISQEYFDSGQSKCLFKASRYPVDVIPMSLIMSDRMPPSCVREINRALLVIMRTGLAQKWRRRYESPGNDCLNTVVINAGDVDKIELKHVVLAFWLLCLGIFIGLLALISEIVWLFMVQDELDDEDEDRLSVSSLSSFCPSTSSSSPDLATNSDESDRVLLGFRRAITRDRQQFASMRLLRAKRMKIGSILRKTKRNSGRRELVAVPKITSNHFDNESNSNVETSVYVVSDTEGLKEVRRIHAQHREERRARRLERETKRRARRIQKTVDLLKRLHGGKIYTSKINDRVRRLSHSVASRLNLGGSQLHGGEATKNQRDEGKTNIRRRRQNTVTHLGARVAPIL